ncbi:MULTISPECIES: ferredoxin [Cupriavidus]|uniref:Ferredoxin n=1 Tax=Cupriavidus pauculus TaxID=82633 RepID=A0A3G8H6K5_9BURK|nr:MULTISPECIES: ferredoxin [Cupriavidus]AZG16183.1 ferredoxin [Cupriavidus pauculus]MDT6963247.1 ferredoxin [Cupriavidus sp. SZY C1]
MFVILTSKPGQFRTEPVPGVEPRETWEYLFYGRPKAVFVIAELTAPRDAIVKVRVIDESGPAGRDDPAPVVNHVPTRFLERFDTLAAAHDALHKLARFGSMDLSIRKI